MSWRCWSVIVGLRGGASVCGQEALGGILLMGARSPDADLGPVDCHGCMGGCLGDRGPSMGQES